MACCHNFIVAVLVFSPASIVCESKKCSTIDIYNCRFNNANTNGCYFHDKFRDCINELIDDCNDSDRLTAKEELKFNDAEKQQCPKLPAGQCFNQEMIQCNNMGVREADCSNMAELAKKTKECFAKVKDNCPSYLWGHEDIRYLINVIEGAERQCGISKD